MDCRQIAITGTGMYVPPRRVTSSELDQRLGLADGWTAKKTGVLERRYTEGETSSQMGAKAARAALEQAGYELSDIDCIVGVSGTAQQEIPCTAALIQRELGGGGSGIPAFDLNSTCLSFVAGLDTISYLVEAGRYRRVLLVASEIASVGLDWEQKESCTLFGDGAAAAIIERTPAGSASRILAARMETYSKGAHLSEIRGGGTMLHPRLYSETTKADFLFQMDGRGIFRMTSRLIEPFVEKLLSESGLGMDEIDWVIPHQASGMSMRILREKLGVRPERFIMNIANYGNTIATSIPLALHETIATRGIKRGDRVLLLGVSAGLSLGGIVLAY
ncbi:beta-ketoacyl-ACP synthase III [Brevibacillus fluminis]|uniref:Beta-ketoacyl-ACP synthase III n=1 Tax=Brevibacillus fluminis TaxID=511487 RepID=A0A3M8DGA7_9BACL|nr:beta-ketoacyl-ACP synthase III [Brevibacillus fluminis]RNB87160.1 beta-ketoacyl-ACP synthase III [Brevibacillus fluminis]